MIKLKLCQQCRVDVSLANLKDVTKKTIHIIKNKKIDHCKDDQIYYN